MPAQNYTRGQEGFDIYSPGVINATNYPWYVSDATKAGVITANAGAFNGNAMMFSGGAAATTIDPSVANQYNPRALQVDGFFSRQGSGSPQVKVGAVIGGTESQGDATAVTGNNTRVTMIKEVPTSTAALDVVQAQLTIEKTT